MAETASSTTAHAASTLSAPEHDATTAPAGSNAHGESNDALEDSSSELSDVDLATNGLEDLDDSILQPTDPDEPPSKRRRLSSSPSPSFLKAQKESPPWKKAGADGPTSYNEGGRRKSGRINLEPQSPSDKRLTRKAHHSSHDSPPAKQPTHSTNGTAPTRRQTVSRPASTPQSASKTTSSRKLTQTNKSSSRRSTSRPARQRSPSPSSQPTRQSTRTRKQPRTSHDGDFDASHVSPHRSRERLRLAPNTLPLVHPEQLPKRAKIGPTFEEYWEHAAEIPLEGGGYLVPDESYTSEQVRDDARAVLRIEDAAEPGGILSQERCSAFAPEPQDEPPRQWAHLDHMVKAAANLRKLMLAEQQRHRSQAKKLADACRDAWLRRQPKSVEELEAEARDAWIARYRVVVKSMFGTWDNVRAEVNRRRLQEWEAEEQKRVKAALNEAVNLSEQKLQAQRGQLDSDEEDELDDDDDDMEGESGENDSELGSKLDDEDMDDEEEASHDDTMSSSDEDEGVADGLGDAGDEGLTQEQLRAKYARLPDLPEDNMKPLTNGLGTGPSISTANEDDNNTADESVDMDSDISLSDETGDEPSDEEEEEGDEGGSGLLGMLFGKSELQKLKEEDRVGMDGTLDQHEGEDDAEGAPAASLDEDPPFGHLDKPHASTPSLGQEDYEDDEPDLVMMPSEETPQNDYTEPSEGNNDSQKVMDTSQPPRVEQPMANGVARDSVTFNDHSKPTAEADQAGPQDVDRADFPGTAADSDATTTPTKPATKPASPDMDAVTRPGSSERNHSPPTSEMKPLDLETESQVLATKSTSRSASPNYAGTPKTEVPFLLRGNLREYQHYGLDWLAGLYANNTNGILADEMGLGKTIQTIALLAHLACYHEVWGPHLVVVPTSVMLNWEMEFKKWCPGFKILAYYGTQEERKRKRHGWTNDDVWNVCITSYQLVLQDQQVFKRRRWHFLILDEAHNIKNFKSQRWQTLLGFNTQARLLLTGTPLQNNLTELWSLLFFLMPSENGVGGFADLQEFHDWFQKPESQILESGRETMDEEARAIISKLHKVLRPYLLRRLKADVEKQMPAKYEHVEFCRLSKRQRELYDGFLARSDTRDTLASGNYMSIINCLMQLRKVCNHPDLFVDRPIFTSVRQQTSVPAEYDLTSQFVQRTILAEEPMRKVSLGVINLIPTQQEGLSTTTAERISQLSLHRVLLEFREAQHARANMARSNLDPSTAQSNLAYLESLGRWRRFEELQHSVYANALRGQRRPIYGKGLVDFLTLGVQQRPQKPRPRIPQKILQWFSEDLCSLRAAVHNADDRAAMMETTVQKFAFVTPSVVTRDMNEVILGRKATGAFTDADLKLSAPIRWAPFMVPTPPVDPWHESRMRLSIQFPDKRLLQYDCGKLQALDKLLRKLQAGGHRALIFTQMTKVLDILEQFLNIHGHKYLRLDGATKVEQRQILTDRFNSDTRILCFILSTRSGGLGINLTGADTVIFYDQDWNPAMDKQCQDRCHRIGQTRDVHIYRLISEHTIEANILRKASQKQMLDDVVIQEGEFNTDYLNKMATARQEIIGEDADLVKDGMDAANAAMDRLLGGMDGGEGRGAGRVLEQAEDKEDVAAAKAAEREIQADDADFQDKAASGTTSGAPSTRQGTPRDDQSGTPGDSTGPGPSGLRFSESVAPDAEWEVNAWGDRMGTIDEHMLRLIGEQLKGTPLELPKDKKAKKKKGKDTRKR